MQGFGRLRRLRKETQRIQARIDQEIEVIESEESSSTASRPARGSRDPACQARRNHANSPPLKSRAETRTLVSSTALSGPGAGLFLPISGRRPRPPR